MSDAKTSEKVQEEHQKNSVFDFLYQDHSRIGAFLSQFDDNGQLTQVSVSDATSQNKNEELKTEVGGGASAIFAKTDGKVSTGSSVGVSGSESSHRVYDTAWVNALTLLDYLEAEGGVVRRLEDARIGQFALVEASLNIVDLSLIKDFYQNDILRKQMIDGNNSDDDGLNRQQKRALKKNAADKKPNELELAFQLMSIFPHSVHMRAVSTSSSCWATLNADGLVTDAGSLFLKYGNNVPGKWQILGVIDSLPEDVSEMFSFPELGAEDFQTNGLAAMFSILGPLIRPILGRPSSDFGITPILIFRQAQV